MRGLKRKEKALEVPSNQNKPYWTNDIRINNHHKKALYCKDKFFYKKFSNYVTGEEEKELVSIYKFCDKHKGNI